jgi:hypothetical protein
MVTKPVVIELMAEEPDALLLPGPGNMDVWRTFWGMGNRGFEREPILDPDAMVLNADDACI